MAADKASLLTAGFDPAFIDKVIQDLGADAQAALQIFADWQAKGWGAAFIADIFSLLPKAATLSLQTIKDVAAMFGVTTGLQAVGPFAVLPAGLIASAKADSNAKKATAPGAPGPFLQWLLKAAQTYGPAVVALLLKLFGINFPLPIPAPTPVGP